MTATQTTKTREFNLEGLISRISAGAANRDADPAFPHEPLAALTAAGIMSFPVPDPTKNLGRRSSFSEEWKALRAISRADGSVGRILDGHLNAVERISVLAPEPLRSRELEAVTAGEILMGVWGADPIPGEGPPARLVHTKSGPVVQGVKTFCSGSTGLDRALLLVRGEEVGPPILVYVNLSGNIEIDRSWYKGAGMRAAESHRVVFHEVPVLAVLGEPGEILREPYFSRDAVRTAACWAGIADRAVESALETLSAKSGATEPDDVVSLAAGKMLTAQGTIDHWLQYAAEKADSDPEASLSRFSTQLREAIAHSCREILDEAARACGSHPFVTGGPLDRARRDLEIFLLQHRIEPALVHLGRQKIQKHTPQP